jgi:hypothetical protein
MRFGEILAHLAVGLHEPLADFTEMLRAVRVGAEQISARDIKRLREAGIADDDSPFDWNKSNLRKMFRGKSGPGGGIEADAASLGFYLTAFMVDGPRREAADRALDMTFARFQQQGDVAACPVTGQRYFGAALMTLLTDRGAFDRAVVIELSSDAGFARIQFENDAEGRGVQSTFWVQEAAEPRKPYFRTKVLMLDGVRFLFDAVNETEAAKTSA